MNNEVRNAASNAQAGKTFLKGHDSILKKLQETKQETIIVTLNNTEYCGTISGRDKYTITLMTEDGIRHVFYKSAIEQFFSIK